MRQQGQHSSAAAASQRCVSAVTRCLGHCEHFVQGLLGAPPGQLQKTAVLPALAEVLRSWARLDEKAGSRAMQEQLAGAIAGLQDALASSFPHLFRHGEAAHLSRLRCHNSSRSTALSPHLQWCPPDRVKCGAAAVFPAAYDAC